MKMKMNPSILVCCSCLLLILSFVKGQEDSSNPGRHLQNDFGFRYYSTTWSCYEDDGITTLCGGLNCVATLDPGTCSSPPGLTFPINFCSCHEGCKVLTHSAKCCLDYSCACEYGYTQENCRTYGDGPFVPTPRPTPKPTNAPVPVPVPVNCGGHYAESCASCPFNSNGNYYAYSWCNGECTWEHDPSINQYNYEVAATQCREKKSSDVDCGYYMDQAGQKWRDGFFRPQCSDCWDYSSPRWCAGDCFEKYQQGQLQCIPHT